MNEKEEIRIGVWADTRGEIIDIKSGEKTICIVHSLPQSHRAGYYFPDTERKVSVIDGSLIFYFTDPQNSKKQKEHKVSIGESVIIQKGTAYREFNEEEVYFASTCIFGSGDKKLAHKPYREIVLDSLK